MKIPRYWARVESAEPVAHHLAAWGWSDHSRSEAEGHARQRLAALEERLRTTGERPTKYAYGRHPLREEIIEQIHGPRDELDAVVTRNSYGCLVVNVAHALFVDIDLRHPTFTERLAAWFGSRRDLAAERLAELRRALQTSPDVSFRIYRTAAGFRVLATNPLFTPGSPDAEALMQLAGADPAFLQLCKLQESFRARLTPKPWRCNLPSPPGQFPREHPDDRAAFAAWLEGYNRVAAAKATCHFLEAIGPGSVHPSAASILRLHDDRTKAQSRLPLA